MTFGEHVVMLRKQLKISQDDLAKKVGTSDPIIGRYEHSEAVPSIDAAKKLLMPSMSRSITWWGKGCTTALIKKPCSAFRTCSTWKKKRRKHSSI